MESILDGIGGIVSAVGTFISEKPITTGLIGAGSVGAGALVISKVVKARQKTKKTTKKTATKKRKTKGRKLKFGSPAYRKKYLNKGKKKKKKTTKRTYKYARTAGKGKDTSTRRIRMTKNGQPYVILRSGKARFIKRSSARRSRKLKGGRY